MNPSPVDSAEKERALEAQRRAAIERALRGRPWKLLRRGLIVSHDESEILGTFHGARESPRKDQVRALISNAERSAELLRAFLSMTESRSEPSADLIARAIWVLTEVRK